MRVRRPTASEAVLGLLCLMYLITYVDRVNVATAANEIKRELTLSNTQLAFVLSAFGYPYVVFQIFGGWLGDRVGPRRTLFVCGLIWTAATILTGFVGSLVSLFLVRLMIGVGEGATFPVATRAMQAWTAAGRRGFAQGHHACVRAAGQCADAADCRLADRDPELARLVRRTRVRQPAVGADVGLVFPRRSRRAPINHHGRTRETAEQRAAAARRQARPACRGGNSRPGCGRLQSSISVTAGRCGCTSTGCLRTFFTNTSFSSGARRFSRRRCFRQALAAITWGAS